MISIIEIIEHGSFSRHKLIKESVSPFEFFLHERAIPLLLFILVGGFGWAIRGTGGWGGTSGAFAVGLWWSLLFIYLGMNKGVDFRRQAICIGIGVGLGGMNGYGQFTSWIKGVFAISNTIAPVPIDPFYGYLNFFLVGIIWGGFAGVGLIWGLNPASGDKGYITWIKRIVFVIVGAVAGYLIVSLNPSVFYPNYQYFSNECVSCIRTGKTADSMGALMGAFIGGFVPGFFEKNKKPILYALIITFAFAIGFSIGSLWFHLGEMTDFTWSWWKQWEITVGAVGGLGIGIVYLLMLDDVQKQTSQPRAETSSDTDISSQTDQTVQDITRNKALRANRLLFQLGFMVFCFYVLSGMGEAIGGYFELEPVGSDSPITKSVVIIIGMAIVLIGMFLSQKKWVIEFKGDELNGAKVKSLYTKFHLVNFMIAFAGCMAIGDQKMGFVYFLFYALITLLVIFSNEFNRNLAQKLAEKDDSSKSDARD